MSDLLLEADNPKYSSFIRLVYQIVLCSLCMVLVNLIFIGNVH